MVKYEGIFRPGPSRCKNKWCPSRGGRTPIPTSGNMPQERGCGTYSSMLREQLSTGGISGRGVTPCTFGYLQKILPGQDVAYIYPYEGKYFNNMSMNSIFDDSYKNPYVPPTLDPRPLNLVGHVWRN